MKLGVLDYGLIDAGKTATEALEETVLLAKKAEELGFSRFWVAEHHNVFAFSTSAPELLMMHLADQTKTIRIGSGGIMPLHYSAFKIAEQIRTLETYHPNRIDLGLGNSLGTRLVKKALKSVHQKEEYYDVLKELRNYLSLSEENPLNITVQPTITSEPQLFSLSSSEETAKVVGELGLGYSFGIFPYMQKNLLEEAQKVPEVYRKNFKPSSFLNKPYVTFAVFIVIAKTKEEANAMARSLDIWMLGKDDFNEFSHYPTIEEAKNYPLSDKEKEIIKDNRQRMIIGTPQEVEKQLNALLRISQADEILAIPLVPGFEQRRQSLELLSQLTLSK
ncbi:LLM class flavin-dependent oxidoreductase [Streptococcus pacificus]|uniref:LLM class flavin-dependent oxidoreductase n=1 Tax=Streptococcus pacificus TaxID=2740577 RepID=A0ABS0ZHP0_9STRE|nr:LLM class flavin-dependent oxidoreductase [Streptococcus pacificus]MBJ8325378.1 LLM class flavin-dependent oxidoreductase [Streptococcus pacificus]